MTRSWHRKQTSALLAFAVVAGAIEFTVLPAWLWEDEGVRTALRDHDIGYLFKVLQRHRLSQRTIARMIGMQQSDVSEIMAGRRVSKYAVLQAICVGLGIPRNLVGLSYAEPPVRPEPGFSSPG